MSLLTNHSLIVDKKRPVFRMHYLIVYGQINPSLVLLRCNSLGLRKCVGMFIDTEQWVEQASLTNGRSVNAVDTVNKIITECILCGTICTVLCFVGDLWYAKKPWPDGSRFRYKYC